MLKFYKYKIFSSFLMTYLLFTEAFSTSNQDGNEYFMTHDDFYSESSSLFSLKFDSFNQCQIDFDSNNIINTHHQPTEDQITDNLIEEISEYDIDNEDGCMDFTPPVSSEITNNISSFISLQSTTNHITSTKKDEDINLSEGEQQKSLKLKEDNNKKNQIRIVKILGPELPEQLEKNKKALPEKKNTKRKISIEEISEFEEEKIDERQNQSPVKKTKKGISWTEEMENRLKELKKEIDPVTDKKYTSQKIAEKMTEEFFPSKFTIPSIDSKWRKIGEDEIVKYTNWNTKMDNLLNELKNTGDYIYEEIAEIMTNNFPSARFTKVTVSQKRGIKPASVKKNTKNGVRWTTEMEEYLKDLKNKINPSTYKKYTQEAIASLMTEKFPPNKFTKYSVGAKWKIIGKNQIVKKTTWDTEMENFLKKLKPTEDHTYEKIAEIMTKKFPSARFTEASVMARWQEIKKGKDKEK